MTSGHDSYFEKLNDYLDSGLDEREAKDLDRHLAGCESCRRALDELRVVARRARELPREEPPERVWTAIASELERRGQARPLPSAHGSSAWLYPALGLAATLVLGFALWLAYRSEEPPRQDPRELASMVTEELQAAESHYDKAIVGLEQIIQQNDGVLPEELKTVLNQNLDLIQGAIDESRAALSTEPESTVAQESLLEALRRKVTLLQNTILLINEVRKGQGDNARDLIDEMRKTPDPI